MIAVESRVGRRVVARLVQGEDVVRALVELCRRFKVHAGEVRVVGALKSAELVEYDQAKRSYRPPRRIELPMEVLSLQGNVSTDGDGPRPHLMLVASRETDAGLQVFGGRLLSGAVFSCEAVVESWDDLPLERKLDRELGLAVWSEPPAGARPTGPTLTAPAPTGATASAPAGGGATWAEAIAASVQKGDERPLSPPRSATSASPAEEDHGFEPDRGDVVDHPQFGRCSVEIYDPADDRIVLRLPTGRLAEIKLHVLTFLAPTEHEGKKVYRVKVNVRR